MSDPKKVSAFIIRDFNDAGTEENFTAGSVVQIEEGRFTSFKFAGLVRTPTADDKKSADTVAKTA